jgi:hypothetical protein
MKHRTRFLALAAFAALLGLSAFALSAPSVDAEPRSRDRHYAGICHDCDWHGRVYDRYDPADEECRDHSAATSHLTEVEVH